jgi:hypothetical protein
MTHSPQPRRLGIATKRALTADRHSTGGIPSLSATPIRVSPMTPLLIDVVQIGQLDASPS